MMDMIWERTRPLLISYMYRRGWSGHLEETSEREEEEEESDEEEGEEEEVGEDGGRRRRRRRRSGRKRRRLQVKTFQRMDVKTYYVCGKGNYDYLIGQFPA